MRQRTSITSTASRFLLQYNALYDSHLVIRYIQACIAKSFLRVRIASSRTGQQLKGPWLQKRADSKC